MPRNRQRTTDPAAVGEPDVPLAMPDHAHHRTATFLRLVAEVSVATALGTDASWLLTVIVSQEDAVWYRPVDFYNGQIMERAGIKSHDTLTRVRDKLIDAGWLYYRPGTKSTPGVYWVLIPEQHRERFGRLLPAADATADSSAPMRSEQADTPQPCGGNGGNHPHPCGGMCVPPNPTPNNPQKSAPAPPAPARGKKSAKTKPKPKPATSVHSQAVEVWCRVWQAKYAASYKFVGGKDGSHIRDILAALEGKVEAFQWLAEQYLADQDPWVAQRRHPLGYLLTHLNQYTHAAPRHQQTEDAY